jgi:aminopeptidase N
MTHMWAGDQTTLADQYDFAWKESMAEYLSYVWEDMTDQTVSVVTANSWKLFGRNAQHFPVPLDKPDLVTYYTDVYGPGPLILFRQLEVQSSRAQVIDALKSVLGTPRALSIDDLVAALQQHTGLDLTTYVATWLKGSGVPAWPRFDLTYTSAATTSTLAIHQLNPTTPNKACKFHVALHGANATDVAMVAVDTMAGGPDQTLSVPTPAFAVTSLVLDPLGECLVFLDVATPRDAPDAIVPWVAPRDLSLAP